MKNDYKIQYNYIIYIFPQKNVMPKIV